jgi:hypothetical protein
VSFYGMRCGFGVILEMTIFGDFLDMTWCGMGWSCFLFPQPLPIPPIRSINRSNWMKGIQLIFNFCSIMFVLFSSIPFHDMTWHGGVRHFLTFFDMSPFRGILSGHDMVWHGVVLRDAAGRGMVLYCHVKVWCGGMVCYAKLCQVMTWCGMVWFNAFFGGFHSIGYMAWSNVLRQVILGYSASPWCVVLWNDVFGWFEARLEEMIFRLVSWQWWTRRTFWGVPFNRVYDMIWHGVATHFTIFCHAMVYSIVGCGFGGILETWFLVTFSTCFLTVVN